MMSGGILVVEFNGSFEVFLLLLETVHTVRKRQMGLGKRVKAYTVPVFRGFVGVRGAFLLFPPLDSPYLPLKISSDFFPGVQKVVRPRFAKRNVGWGSLCDIL